MIMLDLSHHPAQLLLKAFPVLRDFWEIEDLQSAFLAPVGLYQTFHFNGFRRSPYLTLMPVVQCQPKIPQHLVLEIRMPSLANLGGGLEIEDDSRITLHFILAATQHLSRQVEV